MNFFLKEWWQKEQNTTRKKSAMWNRLKWWRRRKVRPRRTSEINGFDEENGPEIGGSWKEITLVPVHFGNVDVSWESHQVRVNGLENDLGKLRILALNHLWKSYIVGDDDFLLLGFVRHIKLSRSFATSWKSVPSHFFTSNFKNLLLKCNFTVDFNWTTLIECKVLARYTLFYLRLLQSESRHKPNSRQIRNNNLNYELMGRINPLMIKNKIKYLFSPTKYWPKKR